MDDNTVEFKRVPALGEEELAEEIRALSQLAKYFPRERIAASRISPLIAALRAKDEKIKELQSSIDECSGSCWY